MKARMEPGAIALRASGWTLKQIGDHYGVSKVAAHRYLQRRRDGAPMRTGGQDSHVCEVCSKRFVRLARRGQLRVYCSHQCYMKDVRRLGAGYVKNRCACRRAREIVAGLYGPLPKGSVVHHVDGNNFNNDPSNLVLFRSQSDHMKHHRRASDSPVPLWEGKSHGTS